MPNKKKKYSARFPPARIKKIMQKDDEVGKVAAAVPVIISRSLELFIESLIKKTNNLVVSKNAKTLTPQHIKQTVQQDKEFNFLNDLVSSIPDVQLNEDEAPGHETIPAPATTFLPVQPTITPSTTNFNSSSVKTPSGKPRGRPKKIKSPEELFLKSKKSKKLKLDDGSSKVSEDSSDGSDSEKPKPENKFITSPPVVTTLSLSTLSLTSPQPTYTVSYPSYKYAPQETTNTSTLTPPVQPLSTNSTSFSPTAMKAPDTLMTLNNFKADQYQNISKSSVMMQSTNDEALDLSTSSSATSSKLKDTSIQIQTSQPSNIAHHSNCFAHSTSLKPFDGMVQAKNSSSIQQQEDGSDASSSSEKLFVQNSYMLNIPKVNIPQPNIFLQQPSNLTQNKATDSNNEAINNFLKLPLQHAPISMFHPHNNFTNSFTSPVSLPNTNAAPFFPASSSASPDIGNS